MSQPTARAIYDKVRPSLVDIHVERAHGEGELHTLGLAVEKGGITAWSGVVSAAKDWVSLTSVPFRQGSQSWLATLHTFRAEWGLCGLAGPAGWSLPLASWRRSTTLSAGGRLVYVIAREAEPAIGWAELLDAFVPDKSSYDRPFIWTARLDPAMPREYAFAFDGEGRVVGLLEPLPDLPTLAALLPGEHVGTLTQRCWSDMLLRMGGIGQLLREYGQDPDSFEAETHCAIGNVLLTADDRDGCVLAWRRAAAKDPWPQRALGSLLVTMEGRAEEGWRLLRRAEELEAREPEGA